jgi:hypothetical protein
MSDGLASNNGMVVNKPDIYHGDRDKLDNWLMQWDLFFMFQGEKVPELKRVTLVSSYMRGKALTWIKPFVLQYNQGNAPDEVDEWMKDFDQFKEKIKPVFGVSNEPVIARRNIQRIRQTASAADYAADFQQLAANTDWDDTALMTMFRQGLKPQVKEELMRTGASTDTLDELVNTAIDIDVKLHELRQELRDDPRARVTTARPPPTFNRNPWKNGAARRGDQRGNHYRPNTGRRIHNNTNSGHYGAEAMDLSNINKGPGRWNEKKQGSDRKHDKSSLTCYGCGKQGHFARDCRMKNKVVRQLNMLTHDDPDDADWEVVTHGVGRLMEDSESDDGYIEGRDESQHGRPLTPYYSTEDLEFSAKCDRAIAQLDKITTRELAKQQQEPDYNHDLDTCHIAQCHICKRERMTVEDWTRELDEARASPAWALTNAMASEGPERIREELQKFLKGYCDQGTQTEDKPHPTAQMKKDCEMALIAINNLLKSEQEWDQQEADEWADAMTAPQTATRDTKKIWKQSSRAPAGYMEDGYFYELDHRNPKHGAWTWAQCTYDACPTHYQDKEASGWFPSKPRRCRHRWHKCLNDKCEYHLIDKRQKDHFPGEDEREAVLKYLVINGKCTNQMWQRCLNSDCQLHKQDKESCGFGDEESFLGQRADTPTEGPSTTLGHIRSLSYPSN